MIKVETANSSAITSFVKLDLNSISFSARTTHSKTTLNWWTMISD